MADERLPENPNDALALALLQARLRNKHQPPDPQETIVLLSAYFSPEIASAFLDECLATATTLRLAKECLGAAMASAKELSEEVMRLRVENELLRAELPTKEPHGNTTWSEAILQQVLMEEKRIRQETGKGRRPALEKLVRERLPEKNASGKRYGQYRLNSAAKGVTESLRKALYSYEKKCQQMDENADM